MSWFYKTEIKINDLSKNICLNGEGSGKIHINDDSYSFDFQSALKDKKWLLGIQFPFRGEELLEVNFDNENYYLSGDFYQKIEQRIKSTSPKAIMDFEIFSKELAFFIEELKNIKKEPKFYEKCEKIDQKYQCKYFYKNRVEKVTIWHQEEKSIEYNRKLNNSLELVASFKYPSEQGFREIDIKLKQLVQKRHDLNYSLQLFNKNCM